MANFPKIAEIWYKLTVFKDISQVAQNPIKTNGSLQANATFQPSRAVFSLGDWQDLKKCPKLVNKLFYFQMKNYFFFHAGERVCPKTQFDPVKNVSKQ